MLHQLKITPVTTIQGSEPGDFSYSAFQERMNLTESAKATDFIHPPSSPHCKPLPLDQATMTEEEQKAAQTERELALTKAEAAGAAGNAISHRFRTIQRRFNTI